MRTNINRKLSGKITLFLLIFSVITSLIHIWFNSFGLIDILRKSMIHLSLMMGLVFLIRPAFKNSPKNKPSIIDWYLFSLSLILGIYFLINYSRIGLMFNLNIYDLIYGAFFIILILEASRRTVGLTLTILAIGFLVYTYYGQYMPGIFAHKGFNLRRIIIRMSMTSEGVLGVAVMISSSYIFMFILFGSFLRATGASKLFNDLALAISGSARGGPAKVSMITSALTGTINGSAQANVVTTGAFTIPLMKSIGYKPYFAGAVEAIASVGGIFMPPIMGAAAFIMSSFLGIPYFRIALVATTPVILYYFSLYNMIDLGAVKWNLPGIKRENLPSIKAVMTKRGHMLVPLILIIVFLLIGFSPLFIAIVGIISVVVISCFRKETRLSLKNIIYALSEGAQDAAPIAIICGVVGFIIGSLGMTGLGQSIGFYIVDFAHGNLFLTAFFCMITAIILGMGLPGTVCYIITATIAAPALIELGVPRLSAHFFAFYFGTMSAVIPPVCLTSFTAATIAKANPNKVALYGLLLGSAGLLLPYMFIYNPVILLYNFTWGNYLFSIFFLAVGLYAAAITIMGVIKGKINLYYRILFFTSAILLIIPEFSIRVVGLLLFIILFSMCRKVNKKKV